MTIWSPVIDERGPVYLAITRALEADIRDGRLRPGDRLPPHRDLAAAIGVNVGTVSRAYAEARRRRLIRGEVGRGTFVCAPLDAALVPRQGSDSSRQTLDLSVNIPLADSSADLREALRALADRVDLERITAYGDPAGAPHVRRAGTRWLESLGVPCEPDRVAVTAGAQHGILVALAAVVGPGERVLAESLTYPGLVASARMLGLRVGPVATDLRGLIPEAVDAACAADRPRLLYCMPALHNPTAAQMDLERRQALVDLARRYDLVIVQDDVLAGLVADPHASLARLAPERVITITGLSKTIAPGLRTAFVAAPPPLARRIAELVWSSTWMSSPIGAELAAFLIEHGHADRTLARRRDEMAARHTLLGDSLAGLDYVTRPGSYHVWLRLPAPWHGSSFAAALDVQGIVVSPAEAFLAAPGPAPHAVRISLSGVTDRADLALALTRIGAEARGAPTAPAVPAVRL